MLHISCSGTLKISLCQGKFRFFFSQMQENKDGGMTIFITVARFSFTNKRK